MNPLFLPPAPPAPRPRRRTTSPTTKVWRAPIWYTSRLILEN